MEAPRTIPQQAQNQLVSSLESYETLLRHPDNYLVIKTSDGGYTTAKKVHWLALKVLSILHFFGLYNGVFHHASQAEKTTLVRDIITVLNTSDNPQDIQRIIRAATPFLGKLLDSLDADLQNELRAALSAHFPRISPENTYTTKEDYIGLLDSLKYGTHVWVNRLADFLAQRGSFTQSQNGEFSPQEIAQFNGLVTEFLQTTPGFHLLEFSDIDLNNELLNGAKIAEIYFHIGNSNLTTIKTYTEIRSYLIANKILGGQKNSEQRTQFLEYLTDKARTTRGFVLPKIENSSICKKFFQRELRLFNESMEEY